MNLRARQSIPLADVDRLAKCSRRTTIIHRGLAVVLLIVLAGAILLAERPGSSAAGLAKGADSGVVVLDLSASIGTPGRSVVDPLEYLADTGQEFGLVLFSGIAYEATPPGTSSAELRPLVHALAPHPDVCLAREGDTCPPETRRVLPGSAEGDRYRRESVTPWNQNFRGGTVISSGLRLARDMLRRHRLEHRGVLLISDLDDAFDDFSALTNELVAYRRERIPLHVVAIDPSSEDRFLFERMIGRESFVERADMTPEGLLDERQRAQRAGVPEGLAALALLLLLLLALNEHFCGRLAWGRER